jgi:uncharacterized protein YcbX
MKNQIGSMVAIHRYPVKSMMGEELNATRIGNKGIQGDRAFALADAEPARLLAPKTHPSGPICSHSKLRSPGRWMRPHRSLRPGSPCRTAAQS